MDQNHTEECKVLEKEIEIVKELCDSSSKLLIYGIIIVSLLTLSGLMSVLCIVFTIAIINKKNSCNFTFP